MNWFKNKKGRVILISLASLFIACSIGAAVGVLVTNSIKQPQKQPITPPNNEPKNPLTNKIVTTNFSTNGIWENKTYLTADDLKEFDAVAFDAFDNPNCPELNYIELLSTMNITGVWLNGLKWINVSEIKVKQVNNTNPNLIICNNLLFSLTINDNPSNLKYLVSTIANRNKIINNLIFPPYKANNPQINTFKYTYFINDNFYNEEIFKNVKQISFLNDFNDSYEHTIYYRIERICANTFRNCKILNPIIKIANTYSLFFLYDKCFFNSNIEEFFFFCEESNDLSSFSEYIPNVFTITPYSFYGPNFQRFSFINTTNKKIHLRITPSNCFLTSANTFKLEVYSINGFVVFTEPTEPTFASNSIFAKLPIGNYSNPEELNNFQSEKFDAIYLDFNTINEIYFEGGNDSAITDCNVDPNNIIRYQ